MFDIGFSELLLIGLVALIVVGPKDLPGMFRTVGRFMGKARGMAREFQRSMEAAADESGLKDAANSLKSAGDFATSPTKSAKNFATQFVKDDDAPPKSGSDPEAEVEAPAVTPADTPDPSPATSEKTAAKPKKTAAKPAKAAEAGAKT